MTLKKIALLSLSVALLSAPALAQSLAPEAQTQNGVTFMSGGIGEEGLDSIRAAEHDYNLRLLFAVQGSGFYLSDVKVQIIDAKGTTLVDTVSQGPYFLAKLKPGRYKVVATSNGTAMTRTIEVPASGRAAQSFYWPSGG
ncbi:MAG TPA: carboxypeptidase regulatory-like domain-containing protein [Alphaproteobacteria bacterium]|nr:carboxypeptidase regulatory-like domain-containing protein [Alphaproteobacteria bacterium]